MFAPRALARSISSITKNHEPSASTKPSRSLEKGRQARAGSLFQLVDMMRINWKPRRVKEGWGMLELAIRAIARTHGIQHAHLNVAVGVPHGVGRGRAAGGNDVAQPAEPEAHGDFAGQRANGAGGDGVHAALLDQAGIIQPVLLFGEIHAAATGAHDDADAAQLVARHVGDVEPGIRHGLGDAGRGQRDGARNVRAVLDLHVLFLVEFVGNLAGYLYLVRGRVEAGDPANPAHAVSRGFPKAFAPDSVRADRTNSCNYCTPHGFNFAFFLLVSIG